jgi:hypothetical protein
MLRAAFRGCAYNPIGAAMDFKRTTGLEVTEIKESETGNLRGVIRRAMLRIALVTVFIGTPAVAHDNGQFGDVPPQVREWFHHVRSANGIPCCDIADGHRTDFDMRKDLYWVPVNGDWLSVPPDAVLKNSGNPTGSAVVWYSVYGGQVIIRCFVPGGGA